MDRTTRKNTMNQTVNSPALPAQGPANMPLASSDDEIHLSEYFDILIDRKWLVMSVAAIVLGLGVAYAVFSTPVYQSNLLIQVEDSAPDAKGFLGDATSLFDVKTPAIGEIQIIRSRMVLGPTVDNILLSTDAQPKFIPVVGTWLAKRSVGLSEPGFFGMGGFVSGTERIDIKRFDVPASMEDGPEFTVTALANGQYTLAHESLATPLTGTVDTLLSFENDGGTIALFISRLDGKPGAQFTIHRASQLVTIEQLQKRLVLAEQGKQSNVINVSLEDSDRFRLSRTLNELGKQYVRQIVERKAAEAEKTLNFLDRQLPEFRKQLEASEAAYTKFRNKNGTVALDEEAKLVLAQTVELQTKLLETQQRRRELAARYTDINPRMETIDAQVGAINRQIGAINSRVGTMPTLQQDAFRLERDVRVNSELYKSLLNSSLQLRLVKEGKIGNVRLLDKAVESKLPVKPQKPLIVALALVLGLLAGTAAAIIRSFYSGGIRSPQEIETHTGLHVYSSVPFTAEQDLLEKRIASKTKGIQLLAHSYPENPAIESLRSLRLAIQFATLDSGNNRVLVTGATPSVGKSFLSSNFAAIMAGAGKRVLLIDADLRRGHIHQQFGVERLVGLSDVVAGLLTPEQAIRPQILPNLDLLTTGKLPPNPADMMMSDSMARVLETLGTQYDYVIIDTPPVLVAADAAAVAPLVGAVLLIARSAVTQLGELNESAKRLTRAGSQVSGVLFNAMDMTQRHYGAGGYKYGGYRYKQYSYGT